MKLSTILTILNNLKRQELDRVIATLFYRKIITLDYLVKLEKEAIKRKELLENYELTPLYNLKIKFGLKKGLSKLAEIVPHQAFTYDKFLIPKIYESEIEEVIGEHYLPEKRKEFEDEILDEISYLNKFIKQTKDEKIGRYDYSDYKYIVYLFKHKYLNLYTKNNLEQCNLELQVDKEGRKFLAVTIKEKYKFHLPKNKIFYKKIKNAIPSEEKEYIPSDEIVEKKSEEYFNKMYILMDYYLKFVLV